MKETSINQAHIKSACEPFLKELGEQFVWQWDEHFQAYLTEFSVDHEQHVFLTAQKHFPIVWDKKELKYADPIFVHRAGFFSNLEKNQRLLSKDKSGENEIMVSWWPWGHGATISVRLFCANTQPYAKPASLLSRLRNIFKSSH